MSVILVTAGFDHRIRFWEAPSGICQRVLKYPDSQVNKLEITPDKVSLFVEEKLTLVRVYNKRMSFFLWIPFVAGKIVMQYCVPFISYQLKIPSIYFCKHRSNFWQVSTFLFSSSFPYCDTYPIHQIPFLMSSFGYV